MKDVQLTDGTVTLRRYRKGDAEELYAAIMESMAEMKLWLPFVHEKYAVRETKHWLKQQAKSWDRGTEFNFAITDASDGTILGGCGLNNVDQDNRLANLGYWVRTSRTGQGVCPAATRLLARWGIRQMKLARIEVLVAADNARSLRAAEKAGAKKEGVLRNRILLHDVSHDAVMHSFVPGEE